MRLTVGEEANTLQDILDDDGLEDVPLTRNVSRVAFNARFEAYLKLAAGASHANRGLVAHDLCSDHGESLALSGVHLARHDTATRLVLWQAQLAQTAARTGTKESDVVRNLHQ